MQKNDPILEIFTFLGNLWGEAFAPLNDEINEDRLRNTIKFSSISLSHLEAKSGWKEDELKASCTAKWGVDLLTGKRLAL